MAEGGEKTESPSESKLKQGRKKGQVAKSADVSTLLSLTFAGLILALTLNISAQKISLLLLRASNGEQNLAFVLKEAYYLWLLTCLPVLLAAFLGAVVGNVLQCGFLLSGHPIKPDFKRLNPVLGLKKLFSKDRVIELLKQLAKLSIIFLVIYQEIKSSLLSISLLCQWDVFAGLIFMSRLIFVIFIRVLLYFSLIAGLDWLWSRHSFHKSMRMSKYEVKKEYQQQEGDPHLKHEQKRRHQETLQGTLVNSDQAKVVITNPGHLAIAIKFDENIDEVPRICAKGVDFAARALIEKARLKGTPILRNVPLARDLCWLDINEEIPRKLYDAVAEILVFISELENKP